MPSQDTNHQLGASSDALQHQLLAEEYTYFLHFAATVIQRHFRGYLARRKYYEQKRRRYQYAAEGSAARQLFLIQDSAARKIQRAWQSYRNKRIFQYYRDLIQFRERGDPKEMLRAINIREASLADAAAGIHVRFRLGGSTFPPFVFYKIFTHRTVTDINAFGPRNYAAEIKMTAKQIHNQPEKKKKELSPDFDYEESMRQYIKPDGTMGYRNTRGWYERYENNGWRPVSERLLLGEDAATFAGKTTKQTFHYNPVVRREERIKLAKQRRRDWLRKLYLPDDQDSQQRAGMAPSSIAADYLLDESQIDELLEWSQLLDYNSYVDDWTSLACTLGSEAFNIPQSCAPTSQIPAPDMNAGMAMSAAGVPLQPFRGGVSPAAGATSGFPVMA